MYKILITVFAFVVLSLTIAVIAQETSGAPSQATGEERLTLEAKDKKESLAAKDLKLEKEYRPRLPRGFGPTGAGVDSAQRERIYKLLTAYNDVIALLELRIELLKEERDVKIDAVLTPAQQQRLNRPIRSLSR